VPTRRDFLKSVCGAAAIALGPVLLADDATAADGIRRLPNGRVTVTVAKVRGLARVGGAVSLGTVKGVPVAVVRTGPQTFRALDLRCTHKGTTVKKDGSGWLCPAHGSMYTGGGTVTHGPAKRSLATVPASYDGSTLTVG
jgi:Rieske Fe-S protein